MARNRKLTIRVSERQYELMQLKKESAGYLNLSEFIRNKIIGNDLHVEKMIREIHHEVVRKKQL